MAESTAQPDITEETVKHVSHLSRLAISDADIPKFAGDLKNIIGLVSQLNELDLDGIEVEISDKDATPFREDTPQKRFDREALLGNAPDPEDGFFKVPKILDN